MPRLFISNRQLDRWLEEGRARVADELLVLDDGRRFRLGPGVYFRSLVIEGDDPHDLLGRVKTNSQLTALGAELYFDSVVLGDVGYSVEPGYVGVPAP